jgi:hypothetical protein
MKNSPYDISSVKNEVLTIRLLHYLLFNCCCYIERLLFFLVRLSPPPIITTIDIEVGQKFTQNMRLALGYRPMLPLHANVCRKGIGSRFQDVCGPSLANQRVSYANRPGGGV